MADETFDGVAVAVGVQGSGFGTPNSTIAALSGSLDLSDGIVLGDAESGDAQSGITIPNIVGVHREVAVIAGSFTEQADAFLKADVTGFQVAWVMQGNGQTTTNPVATGEAEYATTIPGLDAILQSAGLEASDGTDPTVLYKPRASTIYTTWKLWHGDLSLVFSDCLVETLQFDLTPGGSMLCTASIAVGTYDPSTGFADGVTFPTIDYEEMASLTGPTVEGVAFASFGQTRGFENLSISIANTVEKFGDSNVDTSGERQSQTKRVISANGTLYVNTSDSAAAHTNLVSATAPTADLSFQLGTAAGNAEVCNACLVQVNNLQAKDIKYNRIGTALAVELNDSKATATSAGGEFTLTLN